MQETLVKSWEISTKPIMGIPTGTVISSENQIGSVIIYRGKPPSWRFPLFIPPIHVGGCI